MGSQSRCQRGRGAVVAGNAGTLAEEIPHQIGHANAAGAYEVYLAGDFTPEKFLVKFSHRCHRASHESVK